MNRLLQDLEKTVSLYPEKTAFSDGKGDALSFDQLNGLTKRLGTFLAGQGFFRQPIAVLMKKSPAEAAAFLGVWRAGCYYIPLDEEMPKQRLKRILRRVQPVFLIYDKAGENTARELKEEAGQEGGILPAALFEDTVKENADEALLEKISPQILDADPAYVVFTSGSTGEPKGVTACFRSVVDYGDALGDALGFSSETIFASQTPFYFDACLKELLTTICRGATTFLVPQELFLQPLKLVDYLNEHQVNTLCWVVSALTFISSLGTFEKQRPLTLRTVAFGSEVFPKKQFKLWKEAVPDAVFFNLYGPTEATGMSCFYRLERPLEEDEPIPIGAPFQNTEILLLKEDNTPAGDGDEGEICIRGTCVTMGYYADPERTAKDFVQNPLVPWPEIIYRTGDIGRINAHGELVFVSRKDRQIKHMGHRIELGEIEAAAAEITGIRESAVIYDEESHKIRLYYSGNAEKSEVLQGLKTQLPRYMLPNLVSRMEELPHLPNGKLNRKALGKPES